MQPMHVLEQIAARLERLDSKEAVHKAMDEVEFVFELLPPELQDQADQLMQHLRRRLKTLEQ